MKINDLKVGDRVKYNFGPDAILDVCNQGEGAIEKFVAPDRVKLKDTYFDFNIKYIVSKLELIRAELIIPARYKEIPIEKEPKYEHKLRSCCVCEEKEWNYGYSENYYCKKCTRERDKPCYWVPVEKITSHIYPTPVTTYYCPKCDKQLWGTCGMPIKQIHTEPCKECKDKEKSASKSYKSNIRLSKIQSHYMNGKGWCSNAPLNDIEGYGECNTLEVILKNIGIDSSMFDINKQYTIEIKEKE